MWPKIILCLKCCIRSNFYSFNITIYSSVYLFQNIMMMFIACKQAHLFGISHEYIGGTAAKVSWRSQDKKNGTRTSEPACGLLIFKFSAFTHERSDPIG